MGPVANGQVKKIRASGLKGEYFDGTNFERKVFTRIDPAVNFDWEYRATPGPGIGRSFYSVRWTGKLYAPKTGVYKFTATVDDGIRLWVGGRKVMDVWSLNDSKTFQGQISLRAGQYYDLRVDFFNDIYGGSINLFWVPPNETGPAPLSGNFLFQPDLPRPVPAKTAPKPVPPKTGGRPLVAKTGLKPKPAAVIAAKETVPMKSPERFADLKTGDKLVLNQVFFEQSEYRLLPESYAELDKLVRAMRQNSALRIEISGHTDNVGDPRLNRALSENRVSVIANYLYRNGIESQRVETKGYGGTRPVADNTTEAGRSKNRRVELMVK
ncbi:PA14 domain-containing protein [Larkinella ripae]